MIDDPVVKAAFARTVLSAIEEPATLDRMWDDLTSTVTARRPPTLNGRAALRAFVGHAADSYSQTRGAQAAWSYRAAAEFGDALRAALLEKIDSPEGSYGGQTRHRLKFTTLAMRLHARAFPPYWECDSICNQDPPLCVYRSAVAELVASGRYREAWIDADFEDASSPEQRRPRTWNLCQDAAYELIAFPEQEYEQGLNERLAASARRTALCFEQQMLATDPRKIPRTSRRVIAEVMSEAGVRKGSGDEVAAVAQSSEERASHRD
ncbi:MAG TPA: hypothetical protein VKA61_08400 [Sphingomicrobium sp.]|nr:hypothetical protein [Sphingomicrobium sp.]